MSSNHFNCALEFPYGVGRGNSWQRIICSFNLFLSLSGYYVVMAILSPISMEAGVDESLFFTWPYRSLQIIVAVLTLFVSRGQPLPKLNWKYGVFLVFWGLYILRAVYDLSVRSDISPLAWNYGGGVVFKMYFYIFPLSILPIFAVLKSRDLIDFQLALKFLLVFGGIGVVCACWVSHQTIVNSWSAEAVGRMQAGEMLHTQALGEFGARMILCSLWAFVCCKVPMLKRILLMCIIGGGLYLLLKAGSRGPILTLGLAIIFWMFSRSRNGLVGFVAVCISGIIIFAFKSGILDLIERFSPTMTMRLRLFLEDGDLGGRDVLWHDYWQECLRNPIFGYQLDVLGGPHSMILDSFMMFGLILGWIIPFLLVIAVTSCLKVLRSGIPNCWWVLICFQVLGHFFTESNFAIKLAIQIPLVLMFAIDFNCQPKVPHIPALRTSFISKK